MRLAFTIIMAGTISSHCSCAAVPQRTWTPILSLEALDDHLLFRMDISENALSKYHRLIKVTCLKGCSVPNGYTEEDESAGFAGALSLGDQFVTIWFVGDGMLVRVYNLTAASITKVLEENTRDSWPVITASDGKPAIILGDKTIGEILRTGPEPWHRVRGKLWVWNGSAYVAER